MPQNPAPEPEQLLTPSEVAAMFRVNPKTVTRWARAGKISAIRTLGGHRRFRASEIRKFLEQVDEADRASDAGSRRTLACDSSSERRDPATSPVSSRWLASWWPGPASIR